MKYLILLVLSIILISGCQTKKLTRPNSLSLTEIMNQEIITGFFEGDSLKAIKANAYFIPTNTESLK